MFLLRDLAGDEDAEVPTLWCSRPTITWPRALISSVVPYTSATQLKACSSVLTDQLSSTRSVYVDSFVFGLVILVLLLRPEGLFAPFRRRPVERV